MIDEIGFYLPSDGGFWGFVGLIIVTFICGVLLFIAVAAFFWVIREWVIGVRELVLIVFRFLRG